MSTLWVHVESLVSPRAAGELVSLSGEETRHVAARRLRAGDPLVAFDGAGRTAEARIESIGRRAVELTIESVVLAPKPAAGWVLATSIPKGERLAVMLPMLTQLAATVWQPLVLEESVVRELDVESPRLRRILVESAKLARRPWLLEIRPPCSLAELLDAWAGAGRVDFGDREGERSGVPADSAVFAIGPEAGFTAFELERLRTAGGRACRFGPHNLRIETAAVAAAALRATPSTASSAAVPAQEVC
ncbi:16S rRNA (uracil(1498)-N(3))-methyltransferase [Myxococcota bacterium]|nr:16S rRNA (uracil(1498)-N(3))-methyltransferase [Myxococcota bacterium]